jgi:hypothetical protein
MFWSMTLADSVTDWTDSDVAQYELGRTLGLFAGSRFLDEKGTFWTSNPVGNALRAALLALVEGRILEHRDDPDDQFKWCGRV